VVRLLEILVQYLVLCRRPAPLALDVENFFLSLTRDRFELQCRADETLNLHGESIRLQPYRTINVILDGAPRAGIGDGSTSFRDCPRGGFHP